MKKHIKKIIIICIVGFIIFFVWQRFGNKDKNDQNESLIVSMGTVMETVSDSGEIQPVTYANLSFVTPTMIEWVGVDIGDHVTEGQELIRIDRDQLAAQIQAARIDVEKAISRETLARRKWDDYKPEEQYQIKKDVEQAQALLAATQSQWSKTELTSPIDGIITQQDARVGEITSGRVMRVIDPNDLHIESFMSESDVVQMYVGQQAHITFDAFDDEVFTAKITQIDPEAVVLQDVTYYRILLDLDNTDERVRSGMSVDVDIIVQEKNDVVTVPLRFIRTDDAGTYVNVAADDGYEKKYVTLGVEGDEGNVEIVNGVSVGQKIYAIYDDANE